MFEENEVEKSKLDLKKSGKIISYVLLTIAGFAGFCLLIVLYYVIPWKQIFDGSISWSENGLSILISPGPMLVNIYFLTLGIAGTSFISHVRDDESVWLNRVSLILLDFLSGVLFTTSFISTGFYPSPLVWVYGILLVVSLFTTMLSWMDGF